MSVAAPAPKIPGMNEPDRFKLIGGLYRMPRCKVAASCAVVSAARSAGAAST